MREITCYQDLHTKHITAGEIVKYEGEYYSFNGFSAYACDNTLNSLLPKISAGEKANFDPYIGKTYLYQNKYILEVLKQNKNATYQCQGYNEQGKKTSKATLLKQDLQNAKLLA